MRNCVSQLVLAVLLTGLLVSCFGSSDATRATDKSTDNRTIYIRVDGSIDPATAPIQRSGDVYTLTGNIMSDDDGIIVERDNIVIDGAGFTIERTESSWSCGIVLDGRSNVTIQNANINNFGHGIGLHSSYNNNLSGNTMTNNYNRGIWLRSSSDNNIGRNTMMNNGDGIRLDQSSNNRVHENNVFKNIDGIVFYGASSHNSISQNIITNSDVGIYLDCSSNNSIEGNSVTSNNRGILLHEATNNTVCHNNFNNTVQLDDRTPEFVNFWDNGCEGSYWSNYNGVDSDNDGVGETFLPWEGVDNCPLVSVYWNPCDINHDLKTDTRDIGVSARAFGTGPDDTFWNPHADITGLKLLVSDGKVDMRDISLIARYFGESYS